MNHTLNRYSYTKQTTIVIILTNGRPTHATPPSYSHRIWSKHYFAVILNNIILSWVDGNFYRTQWQIFGSDKIVSPCLLLSVCWLTMYTKLTRSGFRLIIPIKCTPNTLQQSEHALHCKHQSLCASSWKMLSVRLEFVTFEYVATFFSLIECATNTCWLKITSLSFQNSKPVMDSHSLTFYSILWKSSGIEANGQWSFRWQRLEQL